MGAFCKAILSQPDRNFNTIRFWVQNKRMNGIGDFFPSLFSFLCDFGCCFLCIHCICGNDTALAVDLFHGLLHFWDFIALLINPCGRQADAPFCWHHIKFVEIPAVLFLRAIFFAVLWVSFPSAATTSRI